ncbi:MAG TPA: gluconeogenesis factor YvcK family protein [Fimbriimonas sp.]|nr:gluconeogenesis factor YvcK family protein [Fimbriimonas sp.]
MYRSYRLRRMFAPTAGLTKAVGGFILGLLALALGFGLSFKGAILPVLGWLSSVTSAGVMQFVQPDKVELTKWLLGGVMLLLGLFLTIRSIQYAIDHVLETINPALRVGKVGDIYVKRQHLAQGPRVVAIGGGTGLSTLLRGLKRHTSNITAIVTVTDDGGSSGRLIKDKGMIPPGDIRNCLVALADAEKSMTDLFQHRFKNDSGSLSGHSMGNLLIAALVDQAKGDFEKAIEIASDVLAIRGRVVPSTLAHVSLRAELENGIEVCGETAIVQAGSKIKQIYLNPEECEPTQEALDAIAAADMVVIGPGSVFTSLIPNLLVPGIMNALKNTKAAKIYICNVMTQPGESDAFTASQHVGAILSNVDAKPFDTVLVNNGLPTEEALHKYRDSRQHFVEPDVDRIRAMGLRYIQGNFMSETDVVRHDPMKLAARLLTLVR